MRKKTPPFKKGDLVRLKDSTDDRQFEIQELFTDNPPEATLVVAGSKEMSKTIALDLLEKIPQQKTIRASPKLLRTDSPVVQSATLPSAIEQPSNKETNISSSTSDQKTQCIETGNVGTGIDASTLPDRYSGPPDFLPSPSGSLATQ